MFLDGIKDAQFVVDKYAAFSWITPLDVVRDFPFMDVDRYASLNSIDESRTLDLARLEHGVAFQQKHGGPEISQSLRHF